MSLVQDLRGRKKIKSQVLEGLKSISSLKVLSCKLHGSYCRKKLVSKRTVFQDFPLLRFRIEYQKGNGTVVKTQLAYPSNVYPYGRQTLSVVNQAALLRYQAGYSWYQLEDRYYQAYDFSLNRIKRMLHRVWLVFNRLVTSRIIPAFVDVAAWLKKERRSFASISFIYRRRMVGGRFGYGDFVKDLFSP